jgi:coproporphyrinogen III oxidase
MQQNLSELKDKFYDYVCDLQDRITAQLREVDPSIDLTEDLWSRTDAVGADGGGGRTRAFSGDVIENAGVNISKVYGKVDEKFADKIGGDGNELWASGLSLIIHPRNPRVPTVHANFRFIHAGGKYWFGGGADLTPYYPHEEDFLEFHTVWKDACAPYESYEVMKKTCDEYFVNKHRDHEMRGIGGIFFDHLNNDNLDQDFKQVTHLAEHFIPSYFPLVKKRMDEEFNEADEDFMLHRRGRYVEFNLLHDRS